MAYGRFCHRSDFSTPQEAAVRTGDLRYLAVLSRLRVAAAPSLGRAAPCARPEPLVRNSYRRIDRAAQWASERTTRPTTTTFIGQVPSRRTGQSTDTSTTRPIWIPSCIEKRIPEPLISR